MIGAARACADGFFDFRARIIRRGEIADDDLAGVRLRQGAGDSAAYVFFFVAIIYDERRAHDILSRISDVVGGTELV